MADRKANGEDVNLADFGLAAMDISIISPEGEEIEPEAAVQVDMKIKDLPGVENLNDVKETTVILTTHDMGDVDALCRRIIIIDEGKKIYDNDIDHLKTFFGSYRTLRMRLEDGSWNEQVIDEKKTDVMHVIQETQKKHKIKDIQLEEISTEEVIRKIYEGSKAS